jgi:hypothetical protein
VPPRAPLQWFYTRAPPLPAIAALSRHFTQYCLESTHRGHASSEQLSTLARPAHAAGPDGGHLHETHSSPMPKPNWAAAQAARGCVGARTGPRAPVSPRSLFHSAWKQQGSPCDSLKTLFFPPLSARRQASSNHVSRAASVSLLPAHQILHRSQSAPRRSCTNSARLIPLALTDSFFFRRKSPTGAASNLSLSNAGRDRN